MVAAARLCFALLLGCALVTAEQPDAAMARAGRASSFVLARRLFGNYVLQVMNLGIRLIDQLLLIPLFIFAWGTELYRDWLVLTALVWFLYSFSFGVEDYFSNIFLQAAAKGDRAALERQVKIGLFISSLIAVTVLASLYCAAGLVGVSRLLGMTAMDGQTATVVLAIMTLPLWCWYQTMVLHGVYRAFGDFSRGECIYAMYSSAQLIGAAIALALRQPPAIVALCYGSMPILCALVTAIDVRRRYGSGIGIAVPTRAELREIVPRSLMYFAGTLSMPLTQQVPLLVLGLFDVSAAALVTFNVCRIFTGLTRMIGVYSFSVGTGIEMARQLIQEDRDGCRKLYADSGRIVSCLAGLLGGFSIPFAAPFVAIWTHGAVSADAALVVCFLAGIFFASPGRPALMLLSYTNNAHAVAVANGIYAVLGLLLSLVLAGPLGPLGVAIALSATEILGIGVYPPAVVSRRFQFGAARHALNSLFAGGCICVLSYAVSMELFQGAHLHPVALIARAAGWAAIMAVPTALVVLPQTQRVRLLGAMRRYTMRSRPMLTK